jgi:hypothetical protein
VTDSPGTFPDAPARERTPNKFPWRNSYVARDRANGAALPQWKLRWNRALGPAIAVAGALVLLAAAFSPWYVLDFKTVNQGHPNEVLFLLFPKGSCDCVLNGNTIVGWYPPDLSALGAVLVLAEYLLVVSIFLGGIGAALGLLSFRVGRRRLLVPSMTLLAAAALVATGASLYAMEQGPRSLHSYLLEVNSGGAGPGKTFQGECSSSECAGQFYLAENQSESWGPGVGWYLALFGSALFLAGLGAQWVGSRRTPSKLA